MVRTYLVVAVALGLVGGFTIFGGFGKVKVGGLVVSPGTGGFAVPLAASCHLPAFQSTVLWASWR